MFSWRYIFLYPDASNHSIQWYGDILNSKWDIFLIAIFIVNIIVLGWFYFFTKPNKSGVLRFWFCVAILVILATVTSYGYLYQNRDSLFVEGTWTYEHTLVALISGFVNGVEIIIIALAIFLLFSLIPLPWQLRAMRRYPFTWFP